MIWILALFILNNLVMSLAFTMFYSLRVNKPLKSLLPRRDEPTEDFILPEASTEDMLKAFDTLNHNLKNNIPDDEREIE